jgi:sensor c-di-GMP phosphodiesterase-like protein
MLSKPTTRVVLTVGILGIAVPVLAALYLAHRQSMDNEVRLARVMAGEVLRRAEAAGDQAIAANRRLSEFSDADPCSDARLALMRDIGMASSYLQTVGYVEDGRLLCSSLGRHRGGIPLGPVAYVSKRGASIRTSVDLGVGEGKRFLMLSRGNCAAAIHPESLVDIYVERGDVALGVLGHDGRQSMSRRGVFDQKWVSELAQSEGDTVFDGDYLVAEQKSDKYDMLAYVAVPASYLRSRLYSFAIVLVPLAIVLGSLSTMGILKLARQRTSLPTELRAALRRRDFVLHYQPIVDLGSDAIVGVEALLRWPTREGLGMGPELFIPVAEASGMIRQLTEYVLERLAQDVPRLLARHPDYYVSVNLSAADLHSEAIVGSLRKLVQTPGISPANIIVEATEHSFVDARIAKHIVTEIRALGIRVAIDDFGTGFSSLSHLTTLKTDYLKIDKVFIETAGTDSVTSQVALHIIKLGGSMGLKIIGEGVETEVQAEFLRKHGVQFAQGWLFHKAMPMDQLLDLDTPETRKTHAA